MCTHSRRCGSVAVYGVPSGMVPTTRSWMAFTTSTACWACSAVPNVVTARNRLVRASLPQMSPGQPECAATAVIAAGWRIWRSTARRPPTYMEASPWTRVIGLPGSNQRGPGVPWIRSRCIAPCGPATRAKMASFNRPRMLPTVSSLGDRTQRRIHVGEQQRRAEELLHAGQRPGPALAVTGRGPHPQVSVADVVELGHGESEVRAAGEATAAPRVAVGIVEPALADRVTASELDDQHRELATGVGRPGVVEVDDAQG